MLICMSTILESDLKITGVTYRKHVQLAYAAVVG